MGDRPRFRVPRKCSIIRERGLPSISAKSQYKAGPETGILCEPAPYLTRRVCEFPSGQLRRRGRRALSPPSRHAYAMTRHDLLSRLRHAPLVAAVIVLGAAIPSASAHTAPVAYLPPVVADSTPRTFWSRDTLSGRSGKVWMKLVSRAAASSSVFWRLFGDSAADNPGVYVARDNDDDTGFRFVILVHFTA